MSVDLRLFIHFFVPSFILFASLLVHGPHAVDQYSRTVVLGL